MKAGREAWRLAIPAHHKIEQVFNNIVEGMKPGKMAARLCV